MSRRRLSPRALSLALGCGLALGTACSDSEGPPAQASLRLVRGADGFVEVELSGATVSPRALELQLEIESEATMLVEDARAAAGRETDTVRSASGGTNRARLFVGDKRGRLLPRSGALARFKVVPADPGASAEARVRISEAKLVSSTPAPIAVELGGAITAR